MHIDELSPPKRLALVYAKGQNRAALALLLLHDVKLGQIIKNGKEPLIGQMRLQWWRDVIAKSAPLRPSGEPLLAALATLEQGGYGAELTAAMAKNVDAWDMLLAHADWTEQVLAAHAQVRADALFGTFADMVRAEGCDALKAGQGWALADLAGYCQTQAQYDAVMVPLKDLEWGYRLPRALRPLSVLVFAAQQQKASVISGMRLILHALTGW